MFPSSGLVSLGGVGGPYSAGNDHRFFVNSVVTSYWIALCSSVCPITAPPPIHCLLSDLYKGF
jgi:hypothetical protein